MGRLSEKERREVYIQRLIEGLCNLEDPVGAIQFHKEKPGVYVRLFHDRTNDPTKISLGFPRSNIMIPHYASIYQWFRENDIEWRDSIRDGQKYMYAQLDRNPLTLSKLILSASKNVFDAESPSLRIDEKITEIAHSAVWRDKTFIEIYGVIILFCIVVFPSYQLIHLFSLGIPSPKNIDWIEFAMIVAFFGGGYSLRFAERKPSVRKTSGWSRRKWWTITLLIWFVVILTSMSTI